MKKLTELNPQWIGYQRTPEHGEGLSLECPSCGPTHTLAAYFSNPIDDGAPAPGVSNWKRTDSTFENITVEPSMHYPCFHGWIEDGLVFHQAESPIVVMMQTPEGIRPVALSPKQAREVCTAVLAKVAEMTAHL
jgi:hypothetical protein